MLAMKVSTVMVRNMVTVNSCGPIAQHTLENSSRTIFTAKEYTVGLMDVNTTANGRTTKWTATASSPGATVASTRACMSTIRSRDMESSRGPMTANMMEIGSMENSMELAHIIQAVEKSSAVNGAKASALAG